MESKQKRRLTYSSIAVAGAVILIVAVILMQQPIQKTAVPPAKTAPGVSTAAATGVGQTTATLNGQLGQVGTASNVTVGFLYAAGSELGGATNVTSGKASAAAPFGKDLAGLTPGTTYYFEAWAVGDGFSTGSVVPFTTLSPPAPQVRAPSVTTKAATAVGSSKATLNGDLGSLGTASSVTVGFWYGANADLAGAMNVSAGPQSATGAFAQAISGLQPGTTYYVQAWAAGNGFASGSVETLTTSTPSSPGNGNIVPPGWAHAACPHLPPRAVAHGVIARCEYNMTYGEMKKQGLADTAQAPAAPPGAAMGAVTRTSDPGNSGEHRSSRARDW